MKSANRWRRLSRRCNGGLDAAERRLVVAMIVRAISADQPPGRAYWAQILEEFTEMHPDPHPERIVHG